MQLPGEKTWTPGVYMGQRDPRSYKVKVGDQEYRCNRRQLIQTNEPPPLPDIQTTPNCSRSFETTPETNRGDTLETTPTQDSGTTSVKLNSEKAKVKSHSNNVRDVIITHVTLISGDAQTNTQTWKM